MPRLGLLGPTLRLIRDAMHRPTLLSLTATLVLAGLSGALAACAPLALKHLVDTATGVGVGGTNQDLLVPAVLYLLVLVGARLSSDARPLLAGRVEQQVLAAMKLRFFAHLMRLPLAYLANRRSGELLHSADLAAAGAQAILGHVTTSIVPVLIELVLMGVILAQLQQPWLVAVFVATGGLYLLVFAVGVYRQRPAISAVSAASLAVHAQLSDGISHVETLRCFGADEPARKSLSQATLLLATRWLRFHGLTMQSAIAASMVFAMALAASLAIAADAVVRGDMTVGGFVLASVCMLQMVRPLETLGTAARDLSRAVGFMKPMLDVLAESIEPTDQPRPLPAVPRTWATGGPSIRLENLTFGYDPQRPVLRDLNLDILAGSTIAIVGRSGSGKSSLGRLLLRLYAPQSGRILLNGQSIDTLPVAELRTLATLVPQDPGLLHASVGANIALGWPQATQAAIELAARHAQIDSLIASLPHGYDTLLGERGQALSGGERQRLAIARALLRGPKLLVLDEPTSMLDARTEAAVMSALREETAGRTTVVIAHRLSSVMHADEIIVLDDGQVHERGRHAELLGKGGLYAQLWRQQSAIGA